MEVADQKYSLQDLSIGMNVKGSQLKEIRDHYIILGNVTNVPGGWSDLMGRIVFMGKELTDECEAICKENQPITILHNEYLEDGVEYDE